MHDRGAQRVERTATAEDTDEGRIRRVLKKLLDTPPKPRKAKPKPARKKRKPRR